MGATPVVQIYAILSVAKIQDEQKCNRPSYTKIIRRVCMLAYLPGPRPAFHQLQYGRAWERGYVYA